MGISYIKLSRYLQKRMYYFKSVHYILVNYFTSIKTSFIYNHFQNKSDNNLATAAKADLPSTQQTVYARILFKNVKCLQVCLILQVQKTTEN